MGIQEVQVSAVLLSGGWESTFCLLQALRKGPVHCFFFDYGQPYQQEEYQAVSKLQKQFGFPLQIIKVEVPRVGKVFTGRNQLFIKFIKAMGFKQVYFGCRNLLDCLDPYKDSNKQFAMRLAKQLGIKIITPALCMPKWLIKHYVMAFNVFPQSIYSSEGYNYDNL